MDGNLHLIARIAGQRVAIAAASIDSVTEIAVASPVPRAPAHVAGLAALRSRVLTLIDCELALGLLQSFPAQSFPGQSRTAGGLRQAVVLAWDGHLYGLLVDAIEDVAALDGVLRQPRATLAAGWPRASLGIVDHGGAALLVIDPVVLIAGLDAAAA